MATAFPMIYGMQTFHAMELLVRGAVNASEEQTLRELLTFLVDEMEYEYLYIANPAYHAAIPADAGSGTGEKNGAEQAQTGMEKDTGTQEQDIPARLVSSCMKPLLTDSLPPQCNVLHRTLVTSIQTSQKYKGSPTRIQIRNLFGPLAQLVSGNTSSKLAQTGLLDFYPSETYQNFEVPDALLKNGIRTLSNELLKVEEFTGPWVRQVGTPRWFHYIPFMNSGVQDNTGSTLATEKIFKERFCRRQLLNLKYAPRQLTATCQFAPYVTPGFPGCRLRQQRYPLRLRRARPGCRAQHLRHRGQDEHQHELRQAAQGSRDDPHQPPADGGGQHHAVPKPDDGDLPDHPRYAGRSGSARCRCPCPTKPFSRN